MRQMEERLAAEHEKRVQYLQQSAVRRILQAGLARGWSAWEDLYLERRRERQLLQQSAARLARPALAACLAHWVRDWEAAERKKIEAARDALRADVLAKQKQSRGSSSSAAS